MKKEIIQHAAICTDLLTPTHTRRQTCVCKFVCVLTIIRCMQRKARVAQQQCCTAATCAHPVCMYVYACV